MYHSRPAVRGLGGMLLLCGIAAACTETPTTPTSRMRAPTKAVASRVAQPTSDRHVFLLSGNIPSNFAASVAARGGQVVSAQPDIGVVITSGLSDADATLIAGKDSVARDYTGRWVPTPDEMQMKSMALPGAIAASSAQSPLLAQFLPFQWNMFQIHAPEAWAVKTGIPKVRVAILDSGLDPDHLDQHGLIDRQLSVAYVPSTTGPPVWADDNLHGTFVGGIVTSNNIGTAGVAPDVKLMAVKVLGADGTGPIGATIQGIVYATLAGAQVINMSLGLYLDRSEPGAQVLVSAMRRAINFAARRGVLVVSASGNDGVNLGRDPGFIELPCEAGVQLCVSATGPGNTLASYSNFGFPAINVAAPGGDGAPSAANWILGPCSSHTADPDFADCANGITYIIAIGTSASAPHVSGLGAYLDSQFRGRLDAASLIFGIQSKADDIGPRGVDKYFGFGQINVARTLGVRLKKSGADATVADAFSR